MTRRALVVAHGAGNSLAELAAAAASGAADAVEADVHLHGGRLEVRHAKGLGPLPVLWERWRLVPRERPPLLLGQLLEAVPPGMPLVLDLKGPDPRLARVVARAAGRFARARGLIVCARLWPTADRLRATDGVRTLHSVGTGRGLRALLARYRPGALEGVVVHRGLLTPARAEALLGRAPWLWTWPVDDPAAADRLEAWGVTGLVSDAPERLRPGACGPASSPSVAGRATGGAGAAGPERG